MLTTRNEKAGFKIFFCLLLLIVIKTCSHRKVKASDQTSSNIFSSFSCACRGAPLWCQGCEKRVLCFPAERRFTIDRQGRAECNSIGDYWATWKTRAARGNVLSGVMIRQTLVRSTCVHRQKKGKRKMQGGTRTVVSSCSWHNWR